MMIPLSLTNTSVRTVVVPPASAAGAAARTRRCGATAGDWDIVISSELSCSVAGRGDGRDEHLAGCFRVGCERVQLGEVLDHVAREVE